MDVYKTPEAQVSTPHDFKPQPIKGVIVGALVDILLSAFLFTVFALVLGAFLASQGASETQIARLFSAIDNDTRVAVASFVISGIGSASGGHVCARYARIHEYRCGMVLATLLTVLSALFEQDAVLLAMGVAVTWAAVMAGVYFAVARNRKEEGSNSEHSVR